MERKTDLTRLLFSISSLADLGQEVSSAKDLEEKMRSALYVVTGMFSVPRAALLAYTPKRRCMEVLAEKGVEGAADIRLCVDAAHLRSFPLNEPVACDDLAGSRLYERNREAFRQLGTKTFVPLFAKNECVGALSLGKRLSRNAYLRSEKDVLKVAAHQLAITLHNARLFLKLSEKVAENKRLYENMHQIYLDTIQAFAAAIDFKDDYTKNHSHRVATYAAAVAGELGWEEKDIEAIYIAGLLHDIGKIVIDSGIINKRDELTTRERDVIRTHPQVSYSILSKIRFPWKNVVQFIRHHHERIDGGGYPDSLAEGELSEGAKILNLADAFDAMVTDRPYRERLTLEEAFREIRRCSGTQFDGKISDVFCDLLRKEMDGDVMQARILPQLRKIGALQLEPARILYEA